MVLKFVPQRRLDRSTPGVFGVFWGVVFDLDRFSGVSQSTAKTIVTRLSDFSDLLELDGNYHGT